MAYDISKSISQGSSGAETQENRRILEVAAELSRRCKLYEAQLWDGEIHVSPLDILFYDTAYSIYAFTGFDGRTVMPVLQQRLVKNATPATSIEIDTYMAALGFSKTANGRFENAQYEAWDLVPRNVLKDAEGDIFIIDAEIKIKEQ